MGDDANFFTPIELAEACLYCDELIVPTTYYIEFDDEIMDLLFKYFTDEDLEILIESRSEYYKCSECDFNWGEDIGWILKKLKERMQDRKRGERKTNLILI